MIKEVISAEGEIVLFIDEIHTLVGAGASEGAMDAANILKPALSRGELHVIGATTLKEYQKYFEKDKALERRFQPVMVNEPDTLDAISILRGIKEKYETHHHVRIKDEAIFSYPGVYAVTEQRIAHVVSRAWCRPVIPCRRLARCACARFATDRRRRGTEGGESRTRGGYVVGPWRRSPLRRG